MKRKLLAVLFAVGVGAAPTIASAQTVLTFEDFTPCDNTHGNVGVYDGVNFQNQFTCYAYAQDPFNPETPPNRVYTSTAAAGNTSSGTFTFAPTTFSGAYLAGTANVFFQLYNGGNLVATSGTLATTSTPTFLASGYSGPVDEVTVSGDGVNFVMDNVTFGTIATPEPTSLALLGTGLVGLVPMMRNRRKR